MSEVIAALLGAVIVLGIYTGIVLTLDLVANIRLNKLLKTHMPYLKEDQD